MFCDTVVLIILKNVLHYILDGTTYSFPILGSCISLQVLLRLVSHDVCSLYSSCLVFTMICQKRYWVLEMGEPCCAEGGKRGGRRTAWAMSCYAMKCKGTPVCTPRCAMLQSTSTWNSDTCANVSTPRTSRGTQVLFVVNSVELHLTALKSSWRYFPLVIPAMSHVF